jgi:tRNA threonylcarbamoyladenosine biosynthesis protein TsaB
LLLAIDTASRFISLALHDGHQLHFESTWHTHNNHTVELAPAIQRALRQVEIGPDDLTAVAVSQGPGSFTGLRIGLGVAKGLALAQDLVLVAVPTLEITAAAVPVFDGALVAVLQAGRGRICAQRFERQDGTWTAAGQAEITDWGTVVEGVGQGTLFAGEVDDTGRARLTSTERPVWIAPGAYALRRAGFLAEIAWARVKAGDTDDPATITPIYLHQPGVPHP